MKRFSDNVRVSVFVAVTASVLSLSAVKADAQVVTIQKLNPAAGEFPEAVGLSNDGQTVYAGLIGANTLVAFDAKTFARKATYNVPASTGIISDSNGNIFTTTAPWFRNVLVGGGANPQDQGIWRITPSGQAAVFGVLPFENVLPNALAVDKSGNIYATNLIGDQIYRVDANGNTTLWSQNSLYAGKAPNDPTSPTPGYPLGGNGAQLRGNILYTDSTDYGRILQTQINPDGSAGAVSVYLQSTSLVGVDAFDIDSAGNVYGANLLTSQILRVTPQGDVTVLANASNGLSSPTGIVLDSATNPGTIYFSNFSLPAFPFLSSTGDPGIGRIDLKANATAAPESGTLALIAAPALWGGVLLARRRRA